MATPTEITFIPGSPLGRLILTPAVAGKPPTLDHTVLEAFDSVLGQCERAAAAGELRVLCIESTAPRFFCAGANLNALRGITANTIGDWVRHGHRVLNRLEALPVPTVARVEGFALGGGLELALACDLIFASDGAQFGQTEARLGFVAGWGGSGRLPRRVGLARAKELFFSARMVPASEAARIGLVDFCGTPNALKAQLHAFAESVAAGSPESHRGHKRLLAGLAPLDLPALADGEAKASVACLQTPDTQNRLAAFFARK